VTEDALALLLRTPPRTVFSGVPDDVWLWLNTEGQRLCPALDDYLPSLPDEALQTRFVGMSGDTALGHAFTVYRIFKGLYETHVGPIEASTTVLDFGCGWGRVLRFFLREVDPARLLGIDPDREIIQAGQATSRWGTFQETERFAPSPFAEEQFDLIYSYSVFSHLSEECHAGWIPEFAQILKPGGMLVVTTWPRSFIEDCARLRAEPGANTYADPNAFQDLEGALAAYDDGRYCFDPVYGLPFFGQTCISERYASERWEAHLDVLGFTSDRGGDRQEFIVARKRAG
jgi:SAM-dependent methyltransferase